MVEELSLSKIDPKKYPVFLNIKNKLIQLEKDLRTKKFNRILSQHDLNIDLCKKLKKIAIKEQDEYCANIAYLLQINVSLIKSIAEFWKLCEEYEYPTAWNHLQDALDCCKILLKFCDTETKESFISIYEYLSLVESLFPYAIFNSSAIDDIETKCSICGRSPFDPDCCHIAGNLYWGEMATNIVVDFKKINHVAMVPNPADKRCTFSIDYDKKAPELSRFKDAYFFIKQTKRPLRELIIQRSEREIPRAKYSYVPKDWPCPCGSGIPFQECCYEKEVIKISFFKISCADE